MAAITPLNVCEERNLTHSSISMRPVREDDREFLYRVYASTREEEMAVAPWSLDEKEKFLRMQFDLQDRHYRDANPNAEFSIVLQDEIPVGRLYVDRRADEIHIIDIALLPECRGSGIGSEILRDVMDEAEEAAKPVRIYVQKGGRAIELYRRLGFDKIGDSSMYDLMEWTPR